MVINVQRTRHKAPFFSEHLIDDLDELETLLLVLRDPRLEEDGVGPELGVEERHVSEHLGEEVDALVTLLEVGVVFRERDGTTWTPERPPGWRRRKTVFELSVFLNI